MSLAALRRKKAELRSGLKKHGTNVEQNELDPMGDGDQSLIPKRGRQYHRNIWAEGGDIHEHGKASLCGTFDTADDLQARFFMACITGNHELVRAELAKVDNANDINYDGRAPPALLALLETRWTSLRLSPLLCLIASAKNIRQGDGSMEALHLKVCQELLSFGARPDAKDVVGRTVCHYGAGVMATDFTLKAIDMCIAAGDSRHLFNQEVELFGLSTNSMNGKRAIARGYQADKNRRAVFLLDEKKFIAVKPDNLRLVASAANGASLPTKIYDIQDRLGGVCLHEVMQSDRIDVAKFLLLKHSADVNIKEVDGLSPMDMASLAGAFVMTTVGRFLLDTQIIKSRTEKKAQRHQCSTCGVEETNETPLSLCAGCRSVQYCCKEHQVADWKNGHKAVCKALAAKKQKGIKLQRPRFAGYLTFIMNQKTGQTTTHGAYRKPDNVAIGERFFVKAQIGTARTEPALLYDETRQCDFLLHPNEKGFDEIYETVKAESATQGLKTHIKVLFDENGDCTVFPGTASLKAW